MKKSLLLGLTLTVSTFGALAQQKLKDGNVTQSNLPNKDAILELESNNKGLLFSRVKLKDTKNPSPMFAHTAGMMVYNTETISDVVPGIYYNDGVKWMLAGQGQATNISYNPTSFTISFLDPVNNSPVVINLQDVVKKNETLTLIVKQENGTYVYTAENGNKTVINIPADVITNFQTIASDNTVRQIIQNLAKGAGGNVYYDGTNFTYVDKNGVTQTINVSELVKRNETITTLTDNNNGTYTYMAEDGKTTIINVPASVITNFQSITNDKSVKQIIENIVKNTSGNVLFDGLKFTYVDNKGVTQNINISEIVKVNETLTVLAYDKATNKLSYTDEKGAKTDLDLNNVAIAYDKTTNTISYTDNKGLVTSLPLNTTALVFDKATNVLTYTDSKGNATTIAVKDLVAANETLTVLAYDKATNKLSYTDEKGAKTDLDLNNGAIDYDKATNTISYTDNKGLVTSLPLNTTALVFDKTTNVLTYTDSKGNATTIAVKDLVVANQLISSVVESSTTSVSAAASTTNARNTEYKVEVKDLAINTLKLANNAVTSDKVADKAITSAKLDAGVGAVGRVAIADANGEVTYQNLTPATLSGKKDITTDGIISVNGANSLAAAVLETTDLKINDNSITARKINAPAGTNKLVLGYDGAGNVVWSTVDGIAGSTTVSNTVAGTSLTTTVNGTTGAPVDLKNAIQTGQKKTVVAAGIGTAVTPSTIGDVTTYTVAADLAKITLEGDVTGAAIATKVEKLQGTPVSAVAPAANQVLTFENGTWVGKKTTVGATDVLNAGNLTSDQITFADGTGATLKNVVATVKARSITAAMLNSDGAVAGQLATADGTGGVTYKTLDATSLNNKKAITGDGITVNSPAGDGSDAVLKDVKLGIADNAITTAKIASDAVETSDIKDKNITAAKLTAGTSSILNRVATADVAGNVIYTDIAALVTGAETKLVNGTNTAVVGSGTIADHYKVNVATANGTALGVVKQGNGSVVVGNDGALSVDAAAITTGKALSSTDLSLSASAGTSLLKDVTININNKAVSAAKLGAATDGSDENKVATADAAGNVTYKAITDASMTSSKGITGTGITVTNGANSTLKDVTLAITPGTSGQVLTTNNTGITTWVNPSTLVPATTNVLSSSVNTLTSTVNGISQIAALINSNSLGLDAGNKLVSTVNGIATTPALDLTPAIASAQKTSSVVNGTTTNVSSTLTGNNTAYKVEVTDAAIQTGQNTTSLSNGGNTTVTSSVNGKNTNYVLNMNVATSTVAGAVKPGSGLAIDGTGILSVDASAIATGKDVIAGSDRVVLAGTPTGAALKPFSIDVDETKLNLPKMLGKVTNNQIATGAANQVLITKSDGTATQWVDQFTLGDNTTADNGLTKTANNIRLGGILTQETTITASATNTLAVAGLQTGTVTDGIMVVDPATSVIKQVKAAMPKFFYMPSVIIPTAADQVVAENGVSGERFGTINLYARYSKQFATPLASSTGAPALPTLPSNELYYYVTWYDNTVFANVKVSADGILTYDVMKNADVTVGSFMNIVFAVK